MRARLAALLPSFVVLALPLGARVAPHASRLGGRTGSADSAVLRLLTGGIFFGVAGLRACAKAGKTAGSHADDALRAGRHTDDAIRAGGGHADDAVRAGGHVHAGHADGAVRSADDAAAASGEGGSLADRVGQEGARRVIEQAATPGDEDEE